MKKTESARDVAHTEVISHSSPSLDAAELHGDNAQADSGKNKPPQRTVGLKLFDVFLYPIVTNFSVFAISVAATYLTNKGGERFPGGALKYGKVGEWFQKRGDWLVGKFKGMGMTHGQADMAKMVTFSFVDGSLMAPVVKAFEDRRERIAKKIDKALNTCPVNDDVYKNEPKQSWLSVLGGRFVTAAIVVPTAVVLDKTGLNHTLFTNPGKKLGDMVAKEPALARLFGKLDIREIFRVSIFEAFYTSVCTAGLYFNSKFIARKTSPKPVAAPHTLDVLKVDDVQNPNNDGAWVSKIGLPEKSHNQRPRLSSEPQLTPTM